MSGPDPGDEDDGEQPDTDIFDEPSEVGMPE